MMHQFIEFRLSVCDPDADTLRSMRECVEQMQELGMDPNVQRVEHSFQPIPSVRLDRVIAVGTCSSNNHMDERKRLTFTVQGKLAVNYEPPTAQIESETPQNQTTDT